MRPRVLTTVAATAAAGGLAASLLASLPATARAAASGDTSTAVSSCDASDSTIYTPPASVSARPGTLLQCEPTSLPEVPGNIPMHAWKVQYASVNRQGQRTAVTGTVAVPDSPWNGPGPRPIIAFNPGTLGDGNQCAFSKQLSGAYQDEYEGDNIAAILKAGFAVAATDMMGFMNGQVHPYVMAVDGAHAILDMARAAPQVPGSGLQPGGKVGIWGYSEGGGLSIWAAQLAASYAPDLHIMGDASGGIPGNLVQLGESLNGGPFAGFLADALVGLHTAYPDMPFTSLLNSNGRSAIKQAESLCLFGTLAAFAFANVQNYTTAGYTYDQLLAVSGPDGTWGDIAAAQDPGINVGLPGSGAKYQIGFPVFQYRAVADEVIPTQMEDAVHTEYCNSGIPTQWATYLGDHLTADNEAIPDVIKFFQARVAGDPPTVNC
jgi:hypothetical protein